MTDTARNTSGWDAMSEKLKHLGKPRTEDVFGDPVVQPTVDDVGIGWEVFHGTLRWDDSGGDFIDGEGHTTGTYKGGAVVGLLERAGQQVVTVIEPREIRRQIDVRRYDWPLNELDPQRLVLLSDARIARYVQCCLRYALHRTKRFWDYSEGDFMVDCVLKLTQAGRDRRAAIASTQACVGGHCTGPGGECSQAKVHIGTCCFCGTVVEARSA